MPPLVPPEVVEVVAPEDPDVVFPPVVLVVWPLVDDVVLVELVLQFFLHPPQLQKVA